MIQFDDFEFPIVHIKKDGQILKNNSLFSNYFGLELNNSNIFDFVKPEDYGSFYSFLNSKRKKASFYFFTLKGKDKRFSLQKINKKGEISLIFRKQETIKIYKEALVNLQNSWNEFFDSLDIGIVIINKQLKVQEVNDFLKKEFALKKKNPTLEDFIPYFPELKKFAVEVINSGKSRILHIKKKGTVYRTNLVKFYERGIIITFVPISDEIFLKTLRETNKLISEKVIYNRKSFLRKFYNLLYSNLQINNLHFVFTTPVFEKINDKKKDLRHTNFMVENLFNGKIYFSAKEDREFLKLISGELSKKLKNIHLQIRKRERLSVLSCVMDIGSSLFESKSIEELIAQLNAGLKKIDPTSSSKIVNGKYSIRKKKNRAEIIVSEKNATVCLRFKKGIIQSEEEKILTDIIKTNLTRINTLNALNEKVAQYRLLHIAEYSLFEQDFYKAVKKIIKELKLTGIDYVAYFEIEKDGRISLKMGEGKVLDVKTIKDFNKRNLNILQEEILPIYQDVQKKGFTFLKRSGPPSLHRKISASTETNLKDIELTFSIFENISTGMILTNHKGIVLKANKSVTNWIEENIVGRDIEKIMGNEFKKALTGERIDRGTFEYGGTTFGFSTSPIMSDNKVIGTLVIVRDLTEIREMEEKLRRQDRLAALGEMSAGMAHEIKNPLASIKTGIEYIKEKSEHKKYRESFVLILKEINRVDRIVKDMISYARRPPLRKKMFNISEASRGIISMYGHSIKEKNIHLSFSTEGDTFIYGDEEQIGEVLTNILLNAIDSVEYNGIINIDISGDENKLKVKVEDNGGGVPEKNMNKIFNPFFTTKTKGTGLGLSITHRIITNHNGNINVKNNSIGGATFTVTLPGKQDE